MYVNFNLAFTHCGYVLQICKYVIEAWNHGQTWTLPTGAKISATSDVFGQSKFD